MNPIPDTNILIADGDYYPFKGYRPGASVSIEVTGVFGGATVTRGFTSSDATPVFVADNDAAGDPDPKTAAGRWTSTRPASGKPALRVTGASGTTAILVKIVDLAR
jgi:hypothetical protein